MDSKLGIHDFNFKPHSEILQEKEERRNSREEIKSIAGGKATRVGKISPGCLSCFTPIYGKTVKVGSECNMNCPYCLDDKDNEPEMTTTIIKKRMVKMYEASLRAPVIHGFAISNGEPLMYMDRIRMAMELVRDIDNRRGKYLWNKLYTNGTLLDKSRTYELRELGFHELRIHPSASNFSDKVYRNIEYANEIGLVVTVEEPAYPPNRDVLLDELKTFDEVGVKHMQLCEVKIYPHSIKPVSEIYPEGRFYPTNEVFLYNDGLTYDIMEEVIDKNYSFSVLECSAELWRSRPKVHLTPDLDRVFRFYRGRKPDLDSLPTCTVK